jgi:hypothetical protein
VQAEAFAKHTYERQAEPTRELSNSLVIAIDELSASLDVERCDGGVTQRPHAAADAIASFQDVDNGALPRQLARGDETRQAGADHDHANAIHDTHVTTV